MAQLIELTMSAERKKSDGNYGSEGQFAAVKFEVHPQDDIAAVIEEARMVLSKVLGGSIASVKVQALPKASIAPSDPVGAPQQAPSTGSSSEPTKRVRFKVTGGVPNDPRNTILRDLGFRWNSKLGGFAGWIERDQVEATMQTILSWGFKVETDG